MTGNTPRRVQVPERKLAKKEYKFNEIWYLERVNDSNPWQRFSILELRALCKDAFGVDIKNKITLIDRDGWVKELDTAYGSEVNTLGWYPSVKILGCLEPVSLEPNLRFFKKTDELIGDRLIYREQGE